MWTRPALPARTLWRPTSPYLPRLLMISRPPKRTRFLASIFVFIYRGPQMIAQKIGMLQTKRLFPKNNDVVDDDPEGFRYGMNTFLNRDSRSPLAVLTRKFVFDETCLYGSLKAQDDQVTSINELNEWFGESVYYMFYNPSTVHTRVQYPVRSRRKVR